MTLLLDEKHRLRDYYEEERQAWREGQYLEPEEELKSYQIRVMIALGNLSDLLEKLGPM